MALVLGANAGDSTNRNAIAGPLYSVDFTQANFTGVLYILMSMIDGTTLTVPSGWSQLPTITAGTARFNVTYKMAPTGIVNFTYSGTRLTAFCGFTVLGADLLEPIRQPAGQSGTSSTVLTPQITTTGGSGDLLVTYSSMFVPLSASSTTNYALKTKIVGVTAVPDYTGGIGGIGTDVYSTPRTGAANANAGCHRPLVAATTYTSPGSTLGNYSQAILGGGSVSWASGAFVLKSSSPSSGRRFFMIV